MLGIKSYVEEEEEKLAVQHRLRSSRRHAETVAKTILSHLDTTFSKANRVICESNNESLNVTKNSGTSSNRVSPWSHSNVDDCSSQDRTRLRLFVIHL